MMKISKKVEYALIALLHMARKSADELTTARELSDKYDISLELMGKILQTLVKNGIVTSVLGVKGGYYLGPSLDQINMSWVITAIDGPIAITDCMNHDDESVCERERNCLIRKSMEEIQLKLVNLMDAITLKDFKKNIG